jgi:hypothetical protein
MQRQPNRANLCPPALDAARAPEGARYAARMTTPTLLRSTRDGRDTRARPRSAPDTGRGGVRIRCPRCRWEPRDTDLWGCRCGHIWNTFHTGGVCPACHYRWEETQCLRCRQWSPHEDWYLIEGDRGQV